MYKNPIEVTEMKPVIEAVCENKEEQLYRAILKIGIDVNKEELVKALLYDRQQYEKGFADGRTELAKALTEHFKSITGMYTDELGFVISRDAVLGGIEFIAEKRSVEL